MKKEPKQPTETVALMACECGQEVQIRRCAGAQERYYASCGGCQSRRFISPALLRALDEQKLTFTR